MRTRTVPGASALSAIRDSLPEANRYAFRAVADTSAAISAHLGVPPAHVALGCGSSEILDAVGLGVHIPGRGPPDSLADLRAAGAIVRARPAHPSRKYGWTRTGGSISTPCSIARRQRPRVSLQSEQPDVYRSRGGRRAGVHRSASMRDRRRQPCSSTRPITSTRKHRGMRRRSRSPPPTRGCWSRAPSRRFTAWQVCASATPWGSLRLFGACAHGWAA